ncbi:MAG: cobalamin-dependent protein [Nitriliruptoraceae bacterium]
MTGPSAAAEQLASEVLSRAPALAQQASARHLAKHPQWVERYGPIAETRCTEDGLFRLRHIAAALSTGRDDLFTAYISWAAGMFAHLQIGVDDLHDHLQSLKAVLTDTFGDASLPAIALPDSAQDHLEQAPVEPQSFLIGDEVGAHLARDYLAVLLAGNRFEAVRMVLAAVDNGLSIESVYLDVFQPALREVGRLWELGRITVAQEHLVTAATQVAMAQLYPQIFGADKIGRTIVVASVGGELHEIGGRMLADIFELRGWDTLFVGANTPISAIVQLATEHRADVVAVSATFGAHVPLVRDVVQQIREQSTARVLVGGRPFLLLPDLWQDTGADGTAADAVAAVKLASQLAAAA